MLATLQAVGAADLRIPDALHIAQSDLADAVGLCPVHLNRTLQRLRRCRLISADPHEIEVLDWPGLQELGQFDPGYLHLLQGRSSASSARRAAQ
jgi:DNA-binding IclR family transcriptional regulator